MRKFDTTKPHYHSCKECHREDYCANLAGCDIPQYYSCLHCERGDYYFKQEETGLIIRSENRPAPIHQIDDEFS